MTKSKNIPSIDIDPNWQQGQLLEITIDDLGDTGDGVGRYQERVIFVPDTVPGDRIVVRLVRVKREYAQGKLQEILTPSPQRVRPSCIVADKCGGCQWQHIDYAYQLKAKENQVRQALERIGKLSNPPVLPILSAGAGLDYRNKATYPFGRSQQKQLQAGYYQKGTHKLVNLNQCPVQDKRLNILLQEVKQDLQREGWSIYDEKTKQGVLRHLSLRIGRRTGEKLLTLIVNTKPVNNQLRGIEEQAQEWVHRFSKLVGVCLNYNQSGTNVIFGEQTKCLAGQPYIREEFAGLQLQLTAETFFQVNTEVAELLLGTILDELKLQGSETIIDAYCGIGTFTLPLAKYLQDNSHGQTNRVIGLEVQPESVTQAKLNATINQLNNVQFYAGEVGDLLPTLDVKPQIILVDPPRKGCDHSVLQGILDLQPERIVYISCKPATLARDLEFLCASGNYQLTKVQPADLFPQTAHVESVAFLERC